MKLDDLSLGALVLIGGALVLISSFQFSAIPGQAYGADTMPRAIGIAGIALRSLPERGRARRRGAHALGDAVGLVALADARSRCWS